MNGKETGIYDSVLHNNRMLDCLHHFIKPVLELLFTTFSQLDFHIVCQGDRCFVVGLVMCDMIEIDQVGLMCTEKIFAFQAAFDLFQYTGEHEIFSIGSDNPGIPALGNAA